MKKFKNKNTAITIGVAGTTETTTMTYANLAKLTLDIAPKGGWTKDEMKIRIKIEDKLEKLDIDKTIKFEDAEMDKIIACSEQPWQFKHKDLVAYLTDLETWYKTE